MSTSADRKVETIVDRATFSALEELANAHYTGLTDDEDVDTVKPALCNVLKVGPNPSASPKQSPLIPNTPSVLTSATDIFNDDDGPDMQAINALPESFDALLSKSNLKALSRAARSRCRSILLDLPAELRVMIYRLLLVSNDRINMSRFEVTRRQGNDIERLLALQPQVLLTSRFVYKEAIEVLWGGNVFYSNSWVSSSSGRSPGTIETTLTSSLTRYPSLKWKIHHLEFDILLPGSSHRLHENPVFLNDDIINFASRLVMRTGDLEMLPNITLRIRRTSAELNIYTSVDDRLSMMLDSSGGAFHSSRPKIWFWCMKALTVFSSKSCCRRLTKTGCSLQTVQRRPLLNWVRTGRLFKVLAGPEILHVITGLRVQDRLRRCIRGLRILNLQA